MIIVLGIFVLYYTHIIRVSYPPIMNLDVIKKLDPFPLERQKKMVKVMTWNIHLGMGVLDSYSGNHEDLLIIDGGSREKASITEVADSVYGIIKTIRSYDPDIIIFTEMTKGCVVNRDYDTLETVFNNINMSYYVYSSDMDALVINPKTYGYWGKMEFGVSIMSKYEIVKAQRFQMPTRQDVSWLHQYLGFKHGLVVADIDVGGINVRIFGAHMDAYATDDTPTLQFRMLDEHLKRTYGDFIVGGDLNQVSQYSEQKSDFDHENHTTYDKYDYWQPGTVSLLEYWKHIYNFAQLDEHDESIHRDEQQQYYTNSIRAKFPFQMKLDYIFSNLEKISAQTIQLDEFGDKIIYSDHCPIIVTYSIYN